MRITKILLLGMLVLFAAACTSVPESDGIHRVVIQVSTDDPRTQTIALNNAVNMYKALGSGNIELEVVAFGPGLSLLTSNSRQGKRVADLSLYDEITFSACKNTMEKVRRKKGKLPKLVEGVGVVPSGVVRIMELQEQGYAYLRP